MKTIGKVWNKVWVPAFWIALAGMLAAGAFMVDTIIGKVLLITPVVVFMVLHITLVVLYLLSVPERREFEEERGRQRAAGYHLGSGFMAAKIVREKRRKEGKRCLWV